MDARKHDTLGNVLRFRRVLRALRPDALVTYNWGSLEWAIANLSVGLRHIHIEDGFGPEESDRQLPRRVWLRRIVLRRSTVVVPSRNLERIALHTWRLPPRRVHYVANGIDLSRFDRRSDARAPPPWPEQDHSPVIGTVATLRAEKNLRRLLQAFAQLRRKARLVIVGDGPERPALEALARELGVAAAVQFPGYLPDPQRAYGYFDVFALSSDTEQMPLSVLEAMASGLPVASTDVGDVARMLAPANQPFIVPRDASALANVIDALLEAPALRQNVGAANRARAEQEFDEQAMFERYRALFSGKALD